MKSGKKTQTTYPEVQIAGDLLDAVNLTMAISKKKTLLILKDGELGNLFYSTKKKLHQVTSDDLPALEKDHRLLTLTFLPSMKKTEPVPDEHVPAEKEKEKKGKKKKEKKGKKGSSNNVPDVHSPNEETTPAQE